MFFLMRSAMCIGLVVAALPDKPVTGAADSPDRDVGLLLQAPATALARFCQAEPSRCAIAIGGVLAAARAGGEPDTEPQPVKTVPIPPAHRATPERVHTGRQVL